MHDHPKGKSSCHCLNAIWMKIFVAATAQRRGKHVNNHIVKQSAICIGNEIQMQKNQEGQRVENRVLPARNTETKLPLRQERAPSSECGQVTESPRSPHHLDAQGHGNNGQYVWVLFSISQCVSQVLNHSILLYCWTIKPTAWWTSLKNNDAPMLHACSKTAILSLSNIPFRFIYIVLILCCSVTPRTCGNAACIHFIPWRNVDVKVQNWNTIGLRNQTYGFEKNGLPEKAEWKQMHVGKSNQCVIYSW